TAPPVVVAGTFGLVAILVSPCITDSLPRDAAPILPCQRVLRRRVPSGGLAGWNLKAAVNILKRLLKGEAAKGLTGCFHFSPTPICTNDSCNCPSSEGTVTECGRAANRQSPW